MVVFALPVALALGCIDLVGVGPFLDGVLSAISVIYIGFFLRHLALSISALRTARLDLVMPLEPGSYTAPVSVLVACKNEEAVIAGLVARLLALDYPPELLQLIVVDDGSTDATPALLDSLAASAPRLLALHRPPGAGGGKSGALNAALEWATGEVIVVFDADHLPRADVVRRLVRHFRDPGVGAVQGRCEVGNPGDSPLAQLVAIDYLAGYLVDEYGRQSLFELPGYGGANCAVRASALRALGGWNVESVTEDTDLTLRLVLSGQRVRYDVTAVDTEEGVVTLGRYWRQRYRWARGHQQAWRDYHRAVWRSSHFSLRDKVETTAFLLGFHLPILTATGTVLFLLALAGAIHPLVPINLADLWMLLFLGPMLELGAGLLIAGAPPRWAWSLIYFQPLFFVSMALCTKAWFDGVLARPYSWVKTQRAGDDEGGDAVAAGARPAGASGQPGQPLEVTRG